MVVEWMKFAINQQLKYEISSSGLRGILCRKKVHSMHFVGAAAAAMNGLTLTYC